MSTKTKYVKVPVSRLPEPNKNKILISSLGTVISGYRTENNNWLILGAEFLGNIEYWLEEKEDHSEEMLSLLEKSRKMIQSLKLSMLVHPDCEEGSEFDDYTTSAQETEDEIEELLNKINNESKI